MNDRQLAIAHWLGFTTLETRNSDQLDFREVAVWQIEEGPVMHGLRLQM